VAGFTRLRATRRRRRSGLLARSIHFLPAALIWAATLYGAETPIPETPHEWVTDTANFLSPETVSALNLRLSQYEQRTGHQVIVYIAPTTGDAPIEDWAVRAFQKWKIGRKGLDDGLALFIFPQDRRMRIEVGYGLEPVVPDAIASRVINDVMAPRLQAGRHDEAVTAAVDALTGTIDKQSGAEPSLTPPARAPAQPAPMSGLESIFWGFIGIVILGILITHPRLAFLFLTSILAGGGGFRGGGGYGWGGGGFGGGGGRSGGGGASGSW
jgi:uncharacterized protein